MKIKIKKLHPDTKLPNYAHPGDVGLDMYSIEKDTVIEPGEREVFGCGFALEFEEGYAAIVKDKSGMAKSGMKTSGGVYDAGYRGEYNVILTNFTKKPVEIKKGQKIAQLIIFPVAIAELEEVETLNDSSRGDGKYGSTGMF